MTFEKIKNANVYKGAGYTDNSHPDSGNLVLMNDGEAFFGGAVYRRSGYPLPVAEPFPKEEPLAQWERELLAGEPEVKEPRFKVGDKIIVKKDQWNIDYTSVDGPVVGEITAIAPSVPNFPGAAYYVEHKTSAGRTLAIYTDRAAEPFLKPAPTSRFKAGDRVVLQNDGSHRVGHAFDGRTGTVLESTFTNAGEHDFDIHVDVDGPGGGSVWFYDNEVDFAPTPPPVTHRYPEGLYQSTTDTSTRVYIQHEEMTDRYAITYLSGPRDEQGIPAVNKYMSAGIVATYTLVTAA